jgi:hypothetical protein
MKNLKLSFGGLILLALLWTSCFKDSFTGIGSERTALVTFAGQILDENNNPIAGAQVSTSGEVSTTDDNGIFRLPLMRLHANNAITHLSCFLPERLLTMER